MVNSGEFRGRPSGMSCAVALGSEFGRRGMLEVRFGMESEVGGEASSFGC